MCCLSTDVAIKWRRKVYLETVHVYKTPFGKSGHIYVVVTHICIGTIVYIKQCIYNTDVICCHNTTSAQHQEEDDAADKQALQSAEVSLTLPGKILNMSALIFQKKFRYTGNKVGALKGWEMLQNDGIGQIHEQKAIRGTDKVANVCNCL